MKITWLLEYTVLLLIVSGPLKAVEPAIWNQWRGPTRDGQVAAAPAWPESLDEKHLIETWRVPLDASYSGPIVSPDMVYTTESVKQKTEVVRALDRKTGKEVWKAEWPGAISVPFFAWSNGSWIRSTPAYDGESLYVAGMRDLLVCLDAKTGQERWKIDFVAEFKAAPPAFGFVCSPLVVGDALYVQAGAAFVKVDKRTGKVLWSTLKDEGGMNGSAFSSPIMADVAGRKQLIVQTREKLAGVDPETGNVYWSQTVPAFRGMNILTPVVYGEGVFTSTYQNKSRLYRLVANGDSGVKVDEAWQNTAQGYMSTPVVIGDYAYVHLQNQRFTCIDLRTGERTWTSSTFGKYCSLVAQGDKILALDQRGILLLIQADPAKFTLLDKRTLTEESTWAHLAVCGDELFVRELEAVVAYRWQKPKTP